MREIKFRAWDEEADRMFYSDYPIDLNFFEFLNGELRAWRVVEAPGTIDESPYPTSEVFDNIMQYTGLTDKNGKEIYEGDIIKWLGHEVKMGKQIRPERIETVNSIFDFVNMSRFQILSKENGTIEIIGNIYENPELIAGGN